MATYVVGDIQGCYQPLRRLLDSVKFQAGRDILWCVGDLVNRGPDSLAVLRFLHKLGGTVKLVLGNHDLHFLALHYGCAPEHISPDHTLTKLLNAPDCDQLAQWLRRQPLARYDYRVQGTQVRHYLMVHAGIAPQWSLQKTLNLSAEVERALKGPGFRQYLSGMYGDTPVRWQEGLMGQERLRVITNYLTRLRFCSADGVIDSQTKEAASQAVDGFAPWFHHQRITPKVDIVFGHWAALDGVTNHPQVHALDTGCVWGRKLTALRLDDHKRFSV